MADLTYTEAQVSLTYVNPSHAETYNVRLAEAVEAGQVLYQLASGLWGLADANAAGKHRARAIALESAGSGSTISVVARGVLDGYDLSGMDYDDPVYLSDTAGDLADAAGTTEVVVGVVWSLPMANGDKERVLKFQPSLIALD